MDTKKTTLREIARIAGVSESTASKVLNDRTDVSQATRDRVTKVMKSRGYRRAGLRSPQDKMPPLIAVFDVVSTVETGLILDGVLSTATELGFDVIVQLNQTPLFSSRRPDMVWRSSEDAAGYLAATSDLPPGLLEHTQRHGIPLAAVVGTTITAEPRKHFVKVGATNWASGHSATSHLLDLGHRHIGWIGGVERSQWIMERSYGFRAALDEAGIADDPRRYRLGESSVEVGVALGGELLDTVPELTAIACASDTLAVGVVEAARERGIVVPRDLSVIGLDDLPDARATIPQLTSVRVPYAGIGQMAVQSLVDMVHGREPASHSIQLSTTVVQRDSTAPPRP